MSGGENQPEDDIERQIRAQRPPKPKVGSNKTQSACGACYVHLPPGNYIIVADDKCECDCALHPKKKPFTNPLFMGRYIAPGESVHFLFPYKEEADLAESRALDQGFDVARKPNGGDMRYLVAVKNPQKPQEGPKIIPPVEPLPAGQETLFP